MRARFKKADNGILDCLTQLTWLPQAALGADQTTWDEALAAVEKLSEQSGRPWRLPSINELESLVDASSHSPALPSEHPFTDVHEAYWSSTTSYFETDWAYVLYLHKGLLVLAIKRTGILPYGRLWKMI